ncbi:Uncharacterized protein BM_BM12912 [Brugia malayi]|uniref:Bm12912 n=2 Tax=Brugia TaxID=6278 RepID=A0A0I9NAE8_BRUMA|nr:Uncharacterized protein BM_BM12912 [Brugia malayi]CTP82105.1 Bm12912 [Brugia malayi]VDO22645.1 unnamed protein product [Brugia timori]VIO96542.1 Uncharacterized protein BM_BM12912 [Brugia malayi]
MVAGEMYGLEWCRHRRIPTIHMARMIQRRELGGRKPGTHFFYGARQFYQCFHPSCSISGVDKKNLIIRRFSPDGRNLVCFSSNCHNLYVYDYRGFTNAYNKQPETMFKDVFSKRFIINLVTDDEEGAALNKEFVFFTEDCRYLLVAAEYPTSENALRWDDVYQNNESLPPVSVQALINYIIYCIDMNVTFSISFIHTGDICDKYYLDADRLWISRGVTLVGHLLAILSFQHQTIHFLHINEDTGYFTLLGHVGRYLFADDEDLVMAAEKSPDSPTTDVVLSGVKQRILTYLYHRCTDSTQVDNFLHTFAQFRSLRMWQMQLVTPSIILIRFVNEEAFAATPGISSYPLLLVLMDWQRGHVLGAFDRYSANFLKLIEKCQEELKYAHVSTNRFPCSIQHCQQALVAYQRMKDALTDARGGSDRETRRRIICQLPYSFSYIPVETPYLDPSMFRFDDRLITLIERTKLSDSEVIRFFSRLTCLPLFEMNLNQGRFVQLLFHPTDPFAISIDRTRGFGTATFHLPPFITPDNPA